MKLDVLRYALHVALDRWKGGEVDFSPKLKKGMTGSEEDIGLSKLGVGRHKEFLEGGPWLRSHLRPFQIPGGYITKELGLEILLKCQPFHYSGPGNHDVLFHTAISSSTSRDLLQGQWQTAKSKPQPLGYA